MDVLELADTLGTLVKLGARHGTKDRNYLRTAHDAISDLVDGRHCVPTTEEHTTAGQQEIVSQEDEPGFGPEGVDVGKIGARHASVDLARIQKVHDILCELGAPCPGKE